MMKFIASDRAAAKAKAKRAFGDKLVVLSVRDLPSGDVEIAASDRPEAAPASNAPQPGSFGREARQAVDEGKLVADRRDPGARLNEPLEEKFTQNSLARFTSHLSRRGGAKKSAEVMSSASTEGLLELLRPHGIDPDLLQALVDGAQRAQVDDDMYRLETAFSETFNFAPIHTATPTPIMLVGPTGAGKTSCAAKLAAKAIQETGSAFLMTADVGRAGAVEQLQTYGETLGADYYVVETPLDVAQVMHTKRPSGFVIFDTPGISPFDSGDLAALRSFQEAAVAEPVLVLPASGDAEEYKDWAMAFGEFGVRRMIITKFDATKRVGAGLTAAHAGRMELANFSETPFISEGLLEASAEFLARRLLASRPGRIGR